MKRVASLYLPHWSIDRLRRAERPLSKPPEPVAADLAPLQAQAAAEDRVQCSVPNTPGWRPGARWARAETQAAIDALPEHRRPPIRDLGRRSEAAGHPFRAMPPDEGGASHLSSPARGGGPAKLVEGARRESNARGAPRSTTRFASGPPPHSGEKPILVTVHKNGSRVEIAAASPEAAALGLTGGMALTQARASVPELDVRDADPEGDRAQLEQLAILLARRWAPIVAISDPDGMFIDLSGVDHLHGGEARMARRLVRMLARAGFTARIAIADTTGAAWALARDGECRDDGARVCRPDRHAPALAPLPVAALRLDDAATTLLHRLGINTIGQLAAMPRAPLVRRFGPAIARRLDQATGAAPEPLDPVVPPQQIALTQRFAEPIATPEAIAHWLGELVPRLTTALAEAGLGARALLLVGARVDNAAQVMRIGFARPTRDPAHILRLITRRIEEIEPGYGLDALTLHVRRADPLGPTPLTETLEQAAPDLAPLVDALANRIGQARLWRMAPVESDVPERSLTATAPLEPPERDVLRLRREDVRRLDMRASDHPWHPRWPRPVRLLRRPEPIDHIMAELPDHAPRRFTWRGITHSIVRADGPERITGEWWKGTGERDAVRDYFHVEDDAGQRFWLFRRGDGVRGATGDRSWFVHGAFG